MTWPLRRRPKSKSKTASSLGSEAWVLVRRRNSSLIRSRALVVRSAFHCEDRKSGKGEKFVAGFLEAGADGLATQLPLAEQNQSRACSTASRLSGIDHSPIILCEFLAQMGRGLGEQVPQLMVGTTLKRHLRPLHL